MLLRAEFCCAARQALSLGPRPGALSPSFSSHCHDFPSTIFNHLVVETRAVTLLDAERSDGTVSVLDMHDRFTQALQVHSTAMYKSRLANVRYISDLARSGGQERLCTSNIMNTRGDIDGHASAKDTTVPFTDVVSF
ncbi:hypothetical protein SNOG_03525 [Parastagonospora nodorum SN15]|uniref:Uncharacterized protein n=1 Tax=Phaeosphaeria nodorum (strain SN15 / ATCC MYA-4574 / FGSC 10173) TaxID=321614 RepID=Q0UXI9_PHANO|nr:hypothetical protein SNOG_03525 [Parastagonospora nodorum SN15]EAT88730.1 hypothetical protein SNOG_03525 [Parastagonospora nodorum SN15]